MPLAAYRLKAGGHEDENGHYTRGDVIQTEQDLVGLFGKNKFEKLESADAPFMTGRSKGEVEKDPGPPPSASDRFEAWLSEGPKEKTVPQLREYADDNEVPLGTLTRKQEIIDEIKKALSFR